MTSPVTILIVIGSSVVYLITPSGRARVAPSVAQVMDTGLSSARSSYPRFFKFSIRFLGITVMSAPLSNKAAQLTPPIVMLIFEAFVLAEMDFHRDILHHLPGDDPFL